jgi:opacity protein-like surface antigen
MRSAARDVLRRPSAPVVGAVLALLSAAPAEAQRARPSADTVPPAPWERRSVVRFAVGGGGLFQTARGANLSRVGDGGGFDAFGALQVSALAVGVGYQRTTHSLRASGMGRAVYDGVFVEPRLSVAPFRNFTPYVAGRASFLRQRVEGSSQFQADRRSLTALGAGVGTLVWLAPSVQLDLAGMYSDVRGGSRTATAGVFTGGTGSGAVLRAGLILGLDNWGR